MATKTRKSEQATAVVRMFLLTALEHDAATDAVHDLIYAHVTEGKYHPTTIPAKLHRVILDVLRQATPDDWDWVARTFISQASEALEVEHPLNSTHEAQQPQLPTKTRRMLRNFDPRHLRAWVTGIVGKHTGIRRQQITATDQNRTCTSSPKALTEREQVIDTARKLDPMTFDIDTRLATHPGKYEGASDLPLAVALNIIDDHGIPDEIRGDAAVRGYAWRVNRFVGVVDLQGFVHSEEYPTLERAIERLRDFDAPHGDEDA